MTQADSIYINGDIITIDDQKPAAQAVAVKEGKIIKVGSNDEILALKGKTTQVIDLTGKTMVPGFY